MMFYSDPKVAGNKYALLDSEVFHLSPEEALEYGYVEALEDGDAGVRGGGGFWVWSCFPGCLPDSGPSGPFATQDEAIEHWRGLLEC